eukprot:c28320_g1_i2 orf=431-1387(-)
MKLSINPSANVPSTDDGCNNAERIRQGQVDEGYHEGDSEYGTRRKKDDLESEVHLNRSNHRWKGSRDSESARNTGQKRIDHSEGDCVEGLDHGKLRSSNEAATVPDAASRVAESRRKESWNFSRRWITQSKVAGNDQSPAHAGIEQEEREKGDRNQMWQKGKNALEASMEMAADFRGSLFLLKETLVKKLAAVPIPAESLDIARQSIESIIREATLAAYGMTKDVVQRIRLSLVEILPVLSLKETREIVDDAEREVVNMSETVNDQSLSGNCPSQSEQNNRDISAPTASAVSGGRPFVPSVLSTQMNRIRSWPLLARL